MIDNSTTPNVMCTTSPRDTNDVGKESATWRLSSDRKTLTVVAQGTDASGVAYTSTQVYEKQ